MEDPLIQLLSQFNSQNEDIKTEDVNFDYILKTYSKQGYILDKSFIDFLRQIYDKKIKYNIDDEINFIDFGLKKVLKDYPKMVIKSYERKSELEGIIPFAEIYNGYMVIVKDQEDYIYGIYDDLVLLFGKSLIEGLENILKNKEIKK